VHVRERERHVGDTGFTHAHTHTHRDTHAQTHTHRDTHAQTHTYRDTHACARAHTHTHTQTHKQTHTHKHTHTHSSIFWPLLVNWLVAGWGVRFGCVYNYIRTCMNAYVHT